jgi:hypothetical protein
MLTDQEKQSLAAMSPEDLAKLLGLIREARAMFTVGGGMPQSAFDDLVKAVPDKLVHEVVNDLKGGRAEPGFLPPAKHVAARRGPPKEVPLETPSGVKYCDQIADHFAELDRRDLQKRLRRL